MSVSALHPSRCSTWASNSLCMAMKSSLGAQALSHARMGLTALQFKEVPYTESPTVHWRVILSLWIRTVVRYSLDLGIGSGLLRKLGRLRWSGIYQDLEGDFYQWIGSACYGAEIWLGWFWRGVLDRPEVSGLTALFIMNNSCHSVIWIDVRFSFWP